MLPKAYAASATLCNDLRQASASILLRLADVRMRAAVLICPIALTTDSLLQTVDYRPMADLYSTCVRVRLTLHVCIEER